MNRKNHRPCARERWRSTRHFVHSGRKNKTQWFVKLSLFATQSARWNHRPEAGLATMGPCAPTKRKHGNLHWILRNETRLHPFHFRGCRKRFANICEIIKIDLYSLLTACVEYFHRVTEEFCRSSGNFFERFHV